VGALLWTLLILAAVLTVWAILTYNGLIAARNEVRNCWSQIDVQLKRRHDLIPNLVETVRGYAKHEAALLQRVAEARSAAVAAAAGGVTGAARAGAAEGVLGVLVGQLLAAVEAYPDLKASTNFLALQEELVSTENRIGFARQAYNDAVASYNTRRETFPNSLIAGSFEKAETFRIEQTGERALPRVEV
jgi:LemA protein